MNNRNLNPSFVSNDLGIWFLEQGWVGEQILMNNNLSKIDSMQRLILKIETVYAVHPNFLLMTKGILKEAYK